MWIGAIKIYINIVALQTQKDYKQVYNRDRNKAKKKKW
jgi:hypothetical protein